MEQQSFEFTRKLPADGVVLIVDDEASIRKTLEDVLCDEGYSPLLAQDGSEALSILKDVKPDLVLLDIWMPGLDGLETLKRIKEIYPDLPVIMISGHATIETAVQATRIGASDFIEKPLDLETILASVARAFGVAVSEGQPIQAEGAPVSGSESEDLQLGQVTDSVVTTPIVFESQLMRGDLVPQRTLANSTLLYGQGLHSGKKSGLVLEPLPPGSGIHFVSVSGTEAVPAHVNYVGSTGFATTVKLGRTQAGTIEHLMSALCAYGISNLLIKCNGEVPVMDGSALEFCAAIEEAGIQEQTGDWYEIAITEEISVGSGEETITVEPADKFSVHYTLKYPDPVGTQRMSFELGDVETYKREIAPARTFGFVKDIGYLQSKGLAQGGRFDNFVLIGDEGVINDALRFPDEPVRHKILDAIGDLYLLGRPIRGKVTATMTGHSDNIDLLKAIYKKMAVASAQN